MSFSKNICFCKETKKVSKKRRFSSKNSKKVEQLELFPSCNYEKIEPREKGERQSYRCPNCGKFVSKEVWEMFPNIYKEETYHHTVKCVKIGGSELPNVG